MSSGKKNSFKRFLMACILALEQIYKVNPPEKEKIVMVQKKDKKKESN